MIVCNFNIPQPSTHITRSTEIVFCCLTWFLFSPYFTPAVLRHVCKRHPRAVNFASHVLYSTHVLTSPHSIAAARREADSLKEKIRAKKEATADTSRASSSLHHPHQLP